MVICQNHRNRQTKYDTGIITLPAVPAGDNPTPMIIKDNDYPISK